MRKRWTEQLKGLLRPVIYRVFSRDKASFDCPICGYHGPFKDKRVSKKPDLVRLDSKCLGCGSAERHRIQYLVLREILKDWNSEAKSMLHIAPEFCLQPILKENFGTYHTADLFAPNVDFKEDIQKMSFEDGTYDAVMVSRVLTIPPDLKASIREIRRVLKPGGIAIVAETYTHDNNVEYGEMREGRSRQIGLDTLGLLRSQFSQVEHFDSFRYDSKYQLINKTTLDGKPMDDYPEVIRVPNNGFMDLVAVCRV